VLTEVIARILAMVGRLLDEWVDLTIIEGRFVDSGLGYIDNLGPSGLIIANTTACGEAFIEELEDMAHSVIGFLTNTLAGITSAYTG